jgi:hypothetical protein
MEQCDGRLIGSLGGEREIIAGYQAGKELSERKAEYRIVPDVRGVVVDDGRHERRRVNEGDGAGERGCAARVIHGIDGGG